MMQMLRDPLLRAWVWLIGFSLWSTALSVWPWSPDLTVASGTLILTLGWLKARVILSHYLGLAATAFWRRGFEICLGLFSLLLLGLYLVAGLG